MQKPNRSGLIDGVRSKL